MTTTSPDTIAPAIEDADKVLQLCGDEDTWPQSEEARAALAWDKGRLVELLAIHAELMRTSFTPRAGDVQAVIDETGTDVAQAATALHRTWVRERAREYSRTLIAARKMTEVLL